MTERILVVDDDRQLTEFLGRFLSKQGYQVASAGSATQLGLLMEHGEFDLILLDIGLPDIDGFQITRELRKTTQTPIILLTVRDEVYDKVIGLEMGADDYVAKPFEPRELLARIRAVLRRAPKEPANTGQMKTRNLAFSVFRIDVDSRQVTDEDGRALPLTSTEYTLLLALVQRPGDVARRDHLMDILYSGAVHVTDRAIDAHIARLRRKLAAAGAGDDLIKTVHGLGYTLAAKVGPA